MAHYYHKTTEKIFHIIYEVINKVNGKFYVGMHSTNKINDDYLGSGKLISYAIKKHGKENFIFNIIFKTYSRELLEWMEKTIIDVDFIKNPLTYNLALGGYGGPMKTDEYRQKMMGAGNPMAGLRGEKSPFYGKTHSKETKKKISESRKGKCLGKDNCNYNKIFSKEIRQKMRESQTGEKNNNFKGYYITPKGKFASRRAAGKANNVCYQTAVYRCKNNVWENGGWSFESVEK